MSDSAQIQKELELKRKKLEEFKKKKAAATAAASDSSSSTSTTSASPAPTEAVNAEDLLSSINSLLIPSGLSAPAKPAAAATVAAAPSSSASAAGGAIKSAKSKVAALKSVKGPEVSIAPAEKITYDAAVQVDAAGVATATSTASSASSQSDESRREEREQWVARESDLNSAIEKLKKENKSLKKELKREDADAEDDPADDNKRELKPAEREEILSSAEFQQFFTRSSVMLERALSVQEEEYDYTVNYSEAGEEEKGSGAAKGEAKLRPRIIFHDAKNSSGRAITSIDWSSKYKELILTSYAARDESAAAADAAASPLGNVLGDPDGTVLVWNLHLAGRPEYSFSCSSAVLQATFHPTHPRLIIGACWSGQIVIWDTREKALPVARSSLAHGHTQPVHAMSIHSPPQLSGLAHLITLSQDGLLCVWEENNLHKPIHENLLRLAPPVSSGSFSSYSQVTTLKDEISAYTFDFPGRDPSQVLLGSDEGHIYRAKIYEKDGIFETIAAHDAPITALQFHPLHKSKTGAALSATAPTADLFLTASYDWTIKLWSNKLASSISAASYSATTNANPATPVHVAPLITFENGRDYVYDVRWHPRSPFIFASVDGTGTIDLYNILDDNHDVPTFSIQVGDSSLDGGISSAFTDGLEGEGVEGISSATAATASKEPRAISRLRWADDGRQLACGSSAGSLHILDVASDYVEPTREQINSFYEKVNKLHSQAQTANILSLSSTSSAPALSPTAASSSS